MDETPTSPARPLKGRRLPLLHRSFGNSHAWQPGAASAGGSAAEDSCARQAHAGAWGRRERTQGAHSRPCLLT